MLIARLFGFLLLFFRDTHANIITDVGSDKDNTCLLTIRHTGELKS